MPISTIKPDSITKQETKTEFIEKADSTVNGYNDMTAKLDSLMDAKNKKDGNIPK